MLDNKVISFFFFILLVQRPGLKMVFKAFLQKIKKGGNFVKRYCRSVIQSLVVRKSSCLGLARIIGFCIHRYLLGIPQILIETELQECLKCWLGRMVARSFEGFEQVLLL